jgi:hypothetical protein
MHPLWQLAAPFIPFVPALVRLLSRWRPNCGAPVFVPSRQLRSLAFRLSLDLQQFPALGELTRAAFRALLSGDTSPWERALQMPHYTAGERFLFLFIFSISDRVPHEIEITLPHSPPPPPPPPRSPHPLHPMPRVNACLISPHRCPSAPTHEGAPIPHV